MWGMTFKKSLEMFDPAYKRVNGGYPFGGGIERRCPKCGVPMAGMEWDPVFKGIKLTCVGGCGFRWSAKPLDSQASRSETMNPEVKELLEAARVALDEMSRINAPYNSFTDAGDRLSAAIAAMRSPASGEV